MRTVTTARWITAILAVLVAAELLFLASGNRRADESFTDPSVRSDMKAVRRILRAQFSRDTPEHVYRSFKQSFSEDSGNQHSASHIVGELLYAGFGIDGLAVCDDTFAYGCYHGFFGRAVGARGLSVIPKLNAACIRKPVEAIGGCQHGIGHGILTYTGDDKLVTALNECKKVPYRGSIRGCVSGVFMEYNMRTMDDPMGRSVRLFSADDPYGPCTHIDDEFKTHCYYEIPQWWETVLSRDYKRIGDLCAAVSVSADRQACFRGVGNIVKFTARMDVGRAVALCTQLGNHEGEMFCRIEAAKSFRSSVSTELSPDQFCTGLSTGFTSQCLDTVQNEKI